MRNKVLSLAIALLSGCNVNAFTLEQALEADKSSSVSSRDKAAIEALMKERYEAFLEKDAHKLVNLFTRDSNFVNQSGRLYWGKEANLKRHIKVFSEKHGEHLLAKTPVTSELLKWCAYGSPVQMVTIVTEYRFITHKTDIMISQYDPMKPTKGIFTTILFKTNHSDSVNGWQIVSMQNTPTLPAQHNERSPVSLQIVGDRGERRLHGCRR